MTTSREKRNIKKNKQNKRLERLPTLKLYFILITLTILFAFLTFRVSVIIFTHGEELERMAVEHQSYSTSDTVRLPNRGTITDSNGNILAISYTVYDVILDITNTYDKNKSLEYNQKYVEENISTLSQILEVSEDEISQYYELDETTGRPVYDVMYKKIADDISFEKGQEIISADLRGVYLEEGTERYYPQQNSASQVVGFLKSDNSSNYYGIEKSYNDYLTGTPGRVYKTYSNSGSTYVNDIPAITGDRVISTIDLNIQNITDETVKKYGDKFEAEKASIIVMDPNTGAIKAMSEYSNFNNNNPGYYELYSNPNLVAEIEKMSPEQQSAAVMDVWTNFNISQTYEPGSTYKPSVVAAAIDEGIISPNETFLTTGSIEVEGHTINSWDKNENAQKTPMDILVTSSNVGMVKIAQKMGAEFFYEQQERFGFGQKTGIDLPAEESASNLVYSPEQLGDIELATSSFGQGFNATTIQSITAFASLINGGNLMVPYVIDEVVSEDGTVILDNEPRIRRKTISASTSDYMREGLQAVVEPGGTGDNAYIEGYSIGGKTGTAEQGIRGTDARTLSFVGYFPVENPQYIIMSVLHRPNVTGYGGGSAAAPMTREVIEGIIQYKDIPPSSPISISNSNNSPTVTLPSYIGMSVEEVTQDILNKGLNYELLSSGDTITYQSIKEGNTAIEGETIFLEAEDKGKTPLVAVPNVVNMPYKDAEQVLINSGFKVESFVRTTDGKDVPVNEYSFDKNDPDEPKGTVKSSSYADNIMLPANTVITLSVYE